MKPVVIFQSGLSYETLCDVRPQVPQAHEWESLWEKVARLVGSSKTPWVGEWPFYTGNIFSL